MDGQEQGVTCGWRAVEEEEEDKERKEGGKGEGGEDEGTTVGEREQETLSQETERYDQKKKRVQKVLSEWEDGRVKSAYRG